MSVAEEELLGPRAWGGPFGSAMLKAEPEDFRVTEILDIELEGEGEHLWLLIRKRGLNTEEVARKLARTAGIKLKDISYAGQKDRQAVTIQWFSLQLPGQADPDFSSLWGEGLQCLESRRHRRKLQRGAHSANHFAIRLTQLQANADQLNACLENISVAGVPNYFGPQRFGRDGNNLVDTRNWAERCALPPARGTRSRLLSTARSLLFNRVLARRVEQGSWNRVLEGDCLAFTDSRSHFAASRMVENDPRLDALDIHPTGPLYGAGEPPVQEEVLGIEHAVMAAEPELTAWLESAGLDEVRRILRLPIRALTWHYPSADCLEIEFTLPTGCFATAVIRELVALVHEPGGGLETEI